MQRCYAFGRALGDAVRAYPGDERIAILASGGLSHDLATPRMGMVNETFDRTLLERLAAGDGPGAVAYGNDHVHEAGNGAEEIRMWLAAHAAAGGGAFVPSYYRAVESWYTGIGMGAWQLP
jgi:aromatic ring-opening dioxygenase catalytic subunit (LigB family)